MKNMSWLVLSVLMFGACSNDDAGISISCTAEELYDQVNDVCVPRGMPTPDTSLPDAGETDASGTNNVVEPDMEVVPDMNLPNPCDRDNDGAEAISCGGNDCDDSAPYLSPLLPEFCDDIDNDCSGVNNDGIDCSFFAHSNDKFYRVDPFSKTIEEENIPMPPGNNILQDIDTHPDGRLFGVSRTALYRFDTTTNKWVKVGADFGDAVVNPNGMAIDQGGAVLITAGNQTFEIDADTGVATLLGTTTGDFYSSGDCVVNKYDTLFMTSKKQDEDDSLILINRETGIGTKIGPIGFKNVYALTSAWGKLWGLNTDGQLITIDERTGAGTLEQTFDGVRFYGAASTPNR